MCRSVPQRGLFIIIQFSATDKLLFCVHNTSYLLCSLLGWCTYYTCLKRLSTFFTIVATGLDYHIWMTGSLPGNLRFHLLNANIDDSIRLHIWYKSPLRKDVYKVEGTNIQLWSLMLFQMWPLLLLTLFLQNGVFIEAQNTEYHTTGARTSLKGDHIPAFWHHSGANYFDISSQVLHLVYFFTQCT